MHLKTYTRSENTSKQHCYDKFTVPNHVCKQGMLFWSNDTVHMCMRLCTGYNIRSFTRREDFNSRPPDKKNHEMFTVQALRATHVNAGTGVVKTRVHKRHLMFTWRKRQALRKRIVCSMEDRCRDRTTNPQWLA